MTGPFVPFELELKESLEATSTLETQLAEAELAVAAEKQWH